MSTKLTALRRVYYPRTGGRDYQAGETIDVADERTAQSMIRRKVAKPAEPASSGRQKAQQRARKPDQSGAQETRSTQPQPAGHELFEAPGTYGRRDMRAED